jgi:hypothetical protein
MVKFDLNALLAAVQHGSTQLTQDSQTTRLNPTSSDEEVPETPPPNVLVSTNRLGMAPPCFPPGTLVHTTTTSPSTFITSPGNVVLPLFPTRANKPDHVPTVTATKKAKNNPKKKTTTKSTNSKKKSSSTSNRSSNSKIPPRSLSQPSLTQTLNSMHEKAAAVVKQSELETSEMQKFMKEEERADMDNYFGDDSMDFLNTNDSDSISGVSVSGSNYSGGILEVYESPDAKPSARKSFATRKFLAKNGRKNDKQKINSSAYSSISRVCQSCQSTSCHNQVHGDFLEKSLENYALTNNKEVLTHMEVYQHFLTTYNTIVQINTHNVVHEVGVGSLPLPACIYSGTFLSMVKQWSVDVKELRSRRRDHVHWMNKREYETKRSNKRRKKYSGL